MLRLVSYSPIVTLSVRRTVFFLDIRLQKCRDLENRVKDFRRKSSIFPTPLYFVPPLKGIPLELGTGAGGQKN